MSSRSKAAAAPEMNPNAGRRASFSRADSFRLYQVLSQMKGVVTEPRHVYALVLLRKKLQPEAEAIEELSKTPERIQEFERNRLDLCRTHAVKDKDGNPVVTPDNNFVIDPEKRTQFEDDIRGIQGSYRKDIESHQQTIKKISDLLAEQSSVGELPEIPVSALSGSVSIEQMEALFPVLIDDLSAR
jgi:hypothetical protein